MSRPARWILGAFAAFFAAVFLLSERTAPSRAPVLGYSFVGFCILIAVACFSRAWRGLTVRIIGTMVFLTYVAYLTEELLSAPAEPYPGISRPHWLNAIVGLIIFGLPGLYTAVRGDYPKWGLGAQAFRQGSAPSTGDPGGPDDAEPK